MTLFLFLASRRGYAVLKALIAAKANICGILCLIEDAHEEAYHPHITALAQEHHIPIFYSSQIKPADYKELLISLKPDIAFAVGWRYLIDEPAYSIPKHGTLILHDSLLPKYRGFAPMNWAIINGETQTGVTLFYIDQGMDSGPIVDQEAIDITLDDTAKTVDERLITLYERILIKNLPALAAGKVKSVAQDETKATYTCKRTPEDGLINWHHSALQIHNLVRGLTHPFPGAYTTFKGKRLFILATELPEIQPNYVGVVPGRIIKKQSSIIEVLTGQGILRIKRLQLIDEEEQEAAHLPLSVKDTLGR